VSDSGVDEAAGVQQPSLLKRVRQMLGVRRLRSDQDLVKLVEERLDVRVLEQLRQSGLTDDEVYSLILPRRTLTHRRARREALSREERIEPSASPELPRSRNTSPEIPNARGPGCVVPSGSSRAAARCNSRRLRWVRASSRSCCTASTRAWPP